MKKLLCVIALAMMAVGFVACKEDTPEVKESGINSKDCEETTQVEAMGGTFNITFDAKASWTIASNKSWVSFGTKTGEAGVNTVNVVIETNVDEAARTAKITLSVKGFETVSLTTISQAGEGVLVTTLNGWINDKMSELYLWNEEYRSLNMDPSLEIGASDFLLMGLEGVNSIQGENGLPVNIEDGGYKRGYDLDTHEEYDTEEREYFSNIQQVGSSFVQSRAATRSKTTLNGLGFYDLRATYLDEAQSKIAVAPLAVYPNSPAAKAGITRGTYINRVNGAKLTSFNYETLVQQLSIGSGTVEVGTAIVSTEEDESGVPIVNEDGPSYTLTAASYDDSPIYCNKVLALSNGVKVGYLAYGQFLMDYDLDLIDVFKTFKEQDIDELVIDLRYNGGGHVMTSTLLATLIVGSQYQGEIYTCMEYNAERTAAGKTGEYRIGDSKIPDGEGVYSLIADALNYALGLNRVYVVGTADTASASEMLINGLRGLGVDVRLVGQRTHGKNVGMEVLQTTAGMATYEFYPISFRAFNKNMESDYANGFTPDVVVPRDIEYAIWDFGNENEIMFQYIFAWIVNGEKPASPVGVMAKPGVKMPGRNNLDCHFQRVPTMQNAYVFCSAEDAE